MHILSMCIRDVQRSGFKLRVRSTRITSSERIVCAVLRVCVLEFIFVVVVMRITRGRVLIGQHYILNTSVIVCNILIR